jgi:hypothetical protein
MNQKLLFGAIVLVLLGVLAGGFAFRTPAVGGVGSAEAYYATTTTSVDASASTSWLACTGSCILGSIVVTQPGSAGWVRIWNATSTATSSYVSDVASSTRLITIGAQIAQVTGATDVGGTYMFDMEASRGIVIETSTGFDGQYIITYKR